MFSSFQILSRSQAAYPGYGLVACLLALAGLAGCGQKGPLYIGITPPPPVQSSLPAAPPAVLVPALPASAAK